MKKPYVSIGDMGLITDVKLVMDSIFAKYVTTKASQSVLDRKRIVSFPKTYQQYSNNADAFADQVKTDLETLFNEYFDSVTVDTSVGEVLREHNTVNINIQLMVYEGGVKYGLNESLSSIESVTLSLFKGAKNVK